MRELIIYLYSRGRHKYIIYKYSSHMEKERAYRAKRRGCYYGGIYLGVHESTNKKGG